jgi:hypothetical protein
MMYGYMGVTPTGKPPPLAVRLAKALPFRRAQIEMRDALTAHDDLHTAEGAHACAHVGVDADHMARQGQRYGTYAMAAGMLQSLQALSPRQWPPLGAFIKLPALRVVHDYQRVAKTPLTFALRQALIFRALRTRHAPGNEVMIAATALTVNFPVFAAGGPFYKISSLRARCAPLRRSISCGGGDSDERTQNMAMAWRTGR